MEWKEEFPYLNVPTYKIVCLILFHFTPSLMPFTGGIRGIFFHNTSTKFISSIELTPITSDTLLYGRWK